MDQFLNPKSMITPGVAGGLAMLLSNTLCFTFPEIGFRYVVLTLSFLLGFVAVVALQAHIGERALYWVVNSLIIFSMGVGTSNIGASIEEKIDDDRGAIHASVDDQHVSVLSFFIGNAQAQDATASEDAPKKKKFFQK